MMSLKYRKIILNKGFALVSEKSKRDDSWFPSVTFFDERGGCFESIPTDSLFDLYEALHVIQHPPSDDQVIAEESDAALSSWRIGIKNNTIRMFVRGDDKPVIVIFRDHACDLFEAMDELI